MRLTVFLKSFFFNKFFVTSSKLVSFSTLLLTFISFFTITIVSFGINYYKNILSESFGEKQPHLILKSFSDEIILDKNQRTLIIKKILKNVGKENIQTITPYIKSNLDVSLEVYANINTPKIEGSFEVIAQYPSYPLAFSFLDAKYFDTNYMPITYKEFLYDYDNLKNMIVINDVVNKGFSPSISANRNSGKLTLYSDNIKAVDFILGAYLKDYKKEPTLYTSAKFLNSLQNCSKDRVSGFAINLHSNDINYLESVKEKLQVFSDDFEVITWLDKNKKQSELIKLYEVLSDMIQILILIAITSAVLLLIFRTLLSIQPQIRSLYLMGHNVGVSSIVIGSIYLFSVSNIGVLASLYTLSYWYSFGLEFLLESGFVSRILLVEMVFISLFIVGVSMIFNIKKIEIK